jgi:uncharacterized delta-60 repeat protein
MDGGRPTDRPNRAAVLPVYLRGPFRTTLRRLPVTLNRLNRQVGLILSGAIALLVATATPGAAAPGDLDPTFDGDGKVTTDFGGRDSAGGVVIQPDGRIVAGGFGAGPGEFDFAVARYETDGSLDPTFDTDGKVTTDFNTSDDRGAAVALQADGKIVVAGQSLVAGPPGPSINFAVVRYNSNGSLDTTFSGDGKVTTDVGNGEDDAATAVAIQADGKIVTAGYVRNQFVDPQGPSDFALVRYNTDGTLDTTFGVGGIVTTDFNLDDDAANGVVIQPDAKIVAVGYANMGTFDFALARYNTNGTLDSTFDGDGKVTTSFGSTDTGDGIALQSDGKIVASGSANISGNIDFALARYNTNGSLDTTFSGDGKVTSDFGGTDHASAVGIQPDGRILAGGYVVTAEGDFALARYTVNGSPDTIFGGGDGEVTTDFGGYDIAHGMAIRADRRVVLAGCAFCFNQYDFGLARYKICRTTSRTISIPC